MPASALAGLSVAQLVDLDADALAVKIEHQHCMTKKAILVRRRGRGSARTQRCMHIYMQAQPRSQEQVGPPPCSEGASEGA